MMSLCLACSSVKQAIHYEVERIELTESIEFTKDKDFAVSDVEEVNKEIEKG